MVYLGGVILFWTEAKLEGLFIKIILRGQGWPGIEKNIYTPLRISRHPYAIPLNMNYINMATHKPNANFQNPFTFSFMVVNYGRD